MPTDDRDWVLEVAATVPGVHGAYHLIDPATGNGLSIAFFEDEAAAQAAREAIEKRAEEIGWHNTRTRHPPPRRSTTSSETRSPAAEGVPWGHAVARQARADLSQNSNT